MRKILLTTLAAIIAFCVFVMVMGDALDARLHHDTLSIEVHNAYIYAAHCGGVVQVEPLQDGQAHEDGSIGRHDVVVVGCDR